MREKRIIPNSGDYVSQSAWGFHSLIPRWADKLLNNVNGKETCARQDISPKVFELVQMFSLSNLHKNDSLDIRCLGASW